MRVLIVQSETELSGTWKRHLDRMGSHTEIACDQDGAVAALQRQEFDVIVLNLLLDDGAAFAVSDFASYRRPNARVIFVTNSACFSDGSIFNHAANARAMISSTAPPDDIAALVEHYGMTG